jgi:hypothetical protein
MSSAIGSLPGAFSAQGNPAPAADRGTIHHLPTGCKTLLGADPARSEDTTRGFRYVAQIVLILSMDFIFATIAANKSKIIPRR